MRHFLQKASSISKEKVVVSNLTMKCRTLLLKTRKIIHHCNLQNNQTTILLPTNYTKNKQQVKHMDKTIKCRNIDMYEEYVLKRNKITIFVIVNKNPKPMCFS